MVLSDNSNILKNLWLILLSVISFTVFLPLKVQWFILKLDKESLISRSCLKVQEWFCTFFNSEFHGLLKNVYHFYPRPSGRWEIKKTKWGVFCGTPCRFVGSTTTTKTTFHLLLTRYWPNFYWKVSGIKQGQQQHHHCRHQLQQNKNNKYISAITDQISTKFEIITIATETTTITTKTKTKPHSTTTHLSY